MTALRLRLECTGVVQGIGFRPYVKQLGDRLQLAGFVANHESHAVIEIEGAPEAIERFRTELLHASPAGSALVIAGACAVSASGGAGFVIAPSMSGPAPLLPRTPDYALCAACRSELFTPGARRYRYPFISCARCGPRYAITASLPFDRERTSYRAFPPCADCAREYADPADRRFHAQTISCPACGPRLAWLGGGGEAHACPDPLAAAVAALDGGALVAAQSVSGFHLLARADAQAAMARLRALKRRPRKPCGLLARSLEDVSRFARVQAPEAALLTSPAAPLVLLDKARTAPAWAEAVAPDNPRLAVMLPATGLHALLMETMAVPLVATSANPADEAVIADPAEAVAAFAGAVDFFLVHDLQILEPQDDAIVQLVAGRPMLLRRGRGYAPALETFGTAAPRRLVAGGAQLKNSCGVLVGQQALISQYQGDLDKAAAAARHAARVARYAQDGALLLKEAHPDVGWTPLEGADWRAIPHHRAHARACAVEHGLEGPHLAVVWDGLGYGEDGGWWGGEFFRVERGAMQRVATLRPIRMPGAAAAIRHPDRVGLALLWALAGREGIAWHRARFGALRFSGRDYANFEHLLADGRHAPWSHSVGRLLDGLASLVDLAHENSFEGEAAMALQFAAERTNTALPLALDWFEREGLRVLDWAPAVAALAKRGPKRGQIYFPGPKRGQIYFPGPKRGQIYFPAQAAGHDDSPGPENKSVPFSRAAAFARGVHHALARAIIEQALESRLDCITLSGGCFQNRLLVELVEALCVEHGLACHWPERHPPNDGGIALGQLALGLDVLIAEEGEKGTEKGTDLFSGPGESS